MNRGCSALVRRHHGLCYRGLTSLLACLVAYLLQPQNSVRYWCSAEKYRLFGAQLAIYAEQTTALSHAIEPQNLQPQRLRQKKNLSVQRVLCTRYIVNTKREFFFLSLLFLTRRWTKNNTSVGRHKTKSR